MIDRNHFTEQAWNAIALSTQAASELGHNYVGTEHLLVGLLLEEEGVASRVLEANGVNADKVKELISQLIFPNQNVGTIGETVYTPGAVRVLNQSYREAVRFKAPLIGTEHLLIAMIRESDCAAVRLLNTMDVSLQKLYEEGLFDHEIKKPIPKNPKKIGVVTARTGAAIHDIISTAKRRNPYVQLVLYPAKVQGEGASDTIVSGIRTLDQYGVDTIIIGRGGGSIEDLWAFNEENVARAIYEAKTPIISGTGHEVDTTIADYAADLRAATPTAACELAVPDITEVMEGIANREYTMAALLKQIIRRYQMKLQKYQITIANYDPRFQLQEQKMRLSELEEQIQQVMKNKMTGYKHKLELYAKELHGLSPTAKLINGFGYLEDQNGEPVTSVHKVKEGDQISLTISDGTILAMAKQIRTMDEKGK